MSETAEAVLARLLSGEEVEAASLSEAGLAQRFRERLEAALSPEGADRLLASLRPDLDERLAEIPDERLRKVMRCLVQDSAGDA